MSSAFIPVAVSSRSFVAFLLLALACRFPSAAAAQKTSSDWAWKNVVEEDSVAIQYIFYAQPGEKRDGVVLKMVNRNDHSITYRFTVIFRSGDGTVHEQAVSGRMSARSIMTGEDAGLFFQPFDEGDSVGMIGIRGYRVRAAGDS